MDGKMTNVESPLVIDQFFSPRKHKTIIDSINNIPVEQWTKEDEMDRYIYSSKWIDKLCIYEMDRAREIFKSDTLLFTYGILAYYKNKGSNLPMHKDMNACTYTMDVCLYSKNPWPIIIEDEKYSLTNNQGLCFYGEDQIHGREPFEEGNEVLVLLIHFAERDHWWFQTNNMECV